MNGHNANPPKNDPMLPVGDRPFWDQEYSEEEAESIQSVAESFVLLKSLKQSRDRWLYNTFPKFSSKGRGNKAPEVAPPPNNTIQNRGKCDVEIGPHLFADTIFYEVHYLSSSFPTSSQNPTSNPYWQSTVPYGSSYSLTTPSNPIPSTSAAVPPSQPEIISTPLISSLTSEASITPGLIHQVNVAASTNPILSNLLQLAAAGLASEAQLKTLGLLIQSLANMESTLSAPTPATQQHPPTQPTSVNANYYRLPTPVKDSDFVLEFNEAPNDRWLIPRGSIYAQLLPNPPSLNADVELTLTIPSNGRMATSSSHQTSAPSIELPVTLRLKAPPSTIWETIVRWAGGEEKMKANKSHLDSLVQPKRLYIGLQLPTGPLLTQLQTACAPAYTMKPLRQGPNPSRVSRQKRSYTSRRTDKTSITVTNESKSVDGPTEAIVVKKSRTSQSKSSTSTPIQCLTCKQTDVPLILGGRFCRPCVDSGKWTPSAPAPVTPVQPTPAQG
ncbi:hypothetical protein GALMADRAFT_234306, partial [Galerina marginata CBS 339.88]